MSPEPSHFPEIKQDKLIELHGELNSFYVCAAGGKPGAEHCFFYGDNQYSFFFYADLVPILDDEYDIVIAAASTQRLRGPNPEILREDLGNIEKNIKKLFRERQFHLPDRHINPTYPARQIHFTWGVGK